MAFDVTYYLTVFCERDKSPTLPTSPSNSGLQSFAVSNSLFAILPILSLTRRGCFISNPGIFQDFLRRPETGIHYNSVLASSVDDE